MYLIGGFCFIFSVIEDFVSVICIPTDAQDLFSPYILSKNAQVYHKQIVQWGGARKGFISSLKIKFIAKFILHPKIAGNKCLIHLLSCSKLYKLSYIELTKSYIRSIFLGQTMSIKFTMNVSQDK